MFFGKKNRNTSKYHFSKYLFTIAFKKQLFVIQYTIKFLLKEENLKHYFFTSILLHTTIIVKKVSKFECLFFCKENGMKDYLYSPLFIRHVKRIRVQTHILSLYAITHSRTFIILFPQS